LTSTIKQSGPRMTWKIPNPKDPDLRGYEQRAADIQRRAMRLAALRAVNKARRTGDKKALEDAEVELSLIDFQMGYMRPASWDRALILGERNSNKKRPDLKGKA
jgi:hypothetical protein